MYIYKKLNFMNTKEKETENTVTEKPVKKTVRKPKTKVEIKVESVKELPLRKEIDKLEIAYMAAINGKMKFKEVRNVFEKLHKEIKSSVKKAKK